MRTIKKISLGIGIAVAAFFALVIAVGVAYVPPHQSIQSTNGIAPQLQTFNSDGNHLSFNVTQVRGGSGSNGQQGKLDVHLQIKNVGTSPIDITDVGHYGTFNYRLIDAQSRTFDSSITELESTKLNPGISTLGIFLFDIPSSPIPVDYKLSITQYGTSYGLIDLGSY